MLNSSRISKIGARILRAVSTGKCTSLGRAGCSQKHYSQYCTPMCKVQAEPKVPKNFMFQRHHFSTGAAEGEKETETINVTFVEKDGAERHIKVPIGMSMLEAAHENDIELEGKSISGNNKARVYSSSIVRLALNVIGACEGCLECSTCHVIVMNVEHYNKMKDPTDEENDMLDMAIGLEEMSRLGCQVIASPELDGLRLSLPAATSNFALDRFISKRR